MRIAVIGCSHGQLDCIYERIIETERRDNISIDLVIICGDFQAVRNEHDLQCMAVPHKYRELATFHKYYCGEKIAPKLTIFIGGNHEASNYLQTLSYGGWVAHNIYYLGYANVLRFAGLRIAGVSGIYHKFDHSLGHFERLPFTESTKRSAYHTRDLDVYRLMQLRDSDEWPTTDPIDIFISHDWPLNIHSCGDVDDLLRKKAHFRRDIQNRSLGNPLLEPLVRHLKPSHWFSAHLHVRFEALVYHTEDRSIQTKFLALDKVLPKRRYMEIIDITPRKQSTDYFLQYDSEWLAILKSTNNLLSINRNCSVPQLWSRLHCVKDDDILEIDNIFQNDLSVAKNFEMCEPALRGRDNDSDPQRTRNYTNYQTTLLCSKLDITDPIAALIDSSKPTANPDQISLSDDEEGSDETLENPQKRPKINEDIDGRGLFFVDRKGENDQKGDNNCNQNMKQTECDFSLNNVQNLQIDDPIIDLIAEEIDLIEDEIDLTQDDDNDRNTILLVDSNLNDVSKGIANNLYEPVIMTKRARRRRAQKIKRRLENKQFERREELSDKINNERKQKFMKRVEQKKAEENKRRLILNRLEWVKSNLPMKSVDCELDVLSLNELPTSVNENLRTNQHIDVIQLDD